MIARLEGTLIERGPTRAVIDVGGVGYEVLISLSTFAALPDEGSDSPVTSESLLQTLLYVLLCLIAGQTLSASLAGVAFTLPSFVWCLFFGVLIRNTTGRLRRLHVHRPTLDVIGSLSLSLFLAMALMSLRLWELLSLAGPLLVLILIQPQDV